MIATAAAVLVLAGCTTGGSEEAASPSTAAAQPAAARATAYGQTVTLPSGLRVTVGAPAATDVEGVHIDGQASGVRVTLTNGTDGAVATSDVTVRGGAAGATGDAALFRAPQRRVKPGKSWSYDAVFRTAPVSLVVTVSAGGRDVARFAQPSSSSPSPATV